VIIAGLKYAMTKALEGGAKEIEDLKLVFFNT